MFDASLLPAKAMKLTDHPLPLILSEAQLTCLLQKPERRWLFGNRRLDADRKFPRGCQQRLGRTSNRLRNARGGVRSRRRQPVVFQFADVREVDADAFSELTLADVRHSTLLSKNCAEGLSHVDKLLTVELIVNSCIGFLAQPLLFSAGNPSLK
jgi:hypothetical protein